ncbi:MAG: NTP transferase domain-containing protein [Deltaproteobacteria bacterium]|nr:NTP transferase domain-containing protein [Deltaproteobacteria bacterium]
MRQPRGTVAPPPSAEDERAQPSCAVILAAGERAAEDRWLSAGQEGRPWPLHRVLGLSLAERTVATGQTAGIDRFVVVLGPGPAEVRALYERIAIRRGCRIEFVEAPDWRLGSGAMLARARTRVPVSPFLLLRGDHLITPGLLDRLLADPLGPGELRMAVDRDRAALPDPERARRVGLAGEEVTRVGPELRWWTAAEAGALLCPRDLFDAVDAEAQGGRHSLVDGLRRLVGRGQVRAAAVTGEPWADVATPGGLRLARRRLLGSLARGRSDGFVTAHVTRPLSIGLTSRLADRDVSPSHVTVASFFAALIGAGFLAAGEYALSFIGAILVLAAAVADGCDHALARLTHQVTARGDWLDTVLDRYADMAVVLAVTVAEASMFPGAGLRIWLGGSLAMTGFLFASYVTKEYALRHGREYPNDVLNRLRRRDLRLFGIGCGALLGVAFEAMVLLGLLSHLCAAGMLVRAWRRQGPFGYRAV